QGVPGAGGVALPGNVGRLTRPARGAHDGVCGTTHPSRALVVLLSQPPTLRFWWRALVLVCDVIVRTLGGVASGGQCITHRYGVRRHSLVPLSPQIDPPDPVSQTGASRVSR